MLMKKIMLFLMGLVMSLSLTSCVTTVHASDDMYDGEVDATVVITYGTPIIIDNMIAYYTYNGWYYYPYWVGDTYYFHKYRRALPYQYFRDWYRPIPPHHMNPPHRRIERPHYSGNHHAPAHRHASPNRHSGYNNRIGNRPQNNGHLGNRPQPRGNVGGGHMNRPSGNMGSRPSSTRGGMHSGNRHSGGGRR